MFSDISSQGYIEKEDQVWMLNTILPQVAKNGLKRIASILQHVQDHKVKAYLDAIELNIRKFGIHYKSFRSIQDTLDWIQEENEKATPVQKHDRPIDRI